MNGGGGKRKTTSEAPYNVVLGGGGGGCSSVLFDGVDLGGVDGGVVQNFERNEGTQLQKSEEDEESHVEVDEKEGVEKEEEGIEGEEEDEEGSDGGGGVVLGENFFEVEAIRRKRVRKGQVQYLIKWNGWPETTNTWEPPENLEFIPDMVEAFEERLKSGKHHKRKRKHVMHCTRTKKCNHTQSAPTLNDPSLHDVFAFPQTMLFYDGAKSSSLGKATPSNANKSANGSEQNMKKNEETDYDPKTTIASGNDSDRLAIQNPEAKSKLKDIYGYIKTFLTKVSQHFK